MAKKIKIKLLKNIVLDGYKKAGDIVEIDNAIAQRLINVGIATPIIEMSQSSLFDEGNCG